MTKSSRNLPASIWVFASVGALITGVFSFIMAISAFVGLGDFDNIGAGALLLASSMAFGFVLLASSLWMTEIAKTVKVQI